MRVFKSKILKSRNESLIEPPSPNIMPYHVDPSTPNLSDYSYFGDENPATPCTIPDILDITTPDISGISDQTEVGVVMLNSSLFHSNSLLADTQNHGTMG